MPIFNRLSKSVHKPRSSGVLAVRYEVPDRRKRHSKAASSRDKKKRRDGRNAEERLQEYLSGSFPGAGTRRRMPRVERNQMLLLTMVIGMALFALFYRLVSA
jgi:hypothetical protein